MWNFVKAGTLFAAITSIIVGVLGLLIAGQQTDPHSSSYLARVSIIGVLVGVITYWVYCNTFESE